MKLSLLYICILLLHPDFANQPGLAKVRNSGSAPAGFAVVELFTSEGCSSCPAAEKVFATLAGNYPAQLYLLEFHVDYWNHLGWADPFSNSAYSERQRKYSTAPGGDGVYTPQAIINGDSHLVGSNESGIRKIIDASLLKPASIAIKISGTAGANKSVSIQYSCPEQKEAMLNIALVQLHAQTTVKAGENSGRTLPHIQIVRDFISLAAGPGSVQLHLPEGANANDFAIIGYLQNKNTFRITGGVSNIIQ